MKARVFYIVLILVTLGLGAVIVLMPWQKGILRAHAGDFCIVIFLYCLVQIVFLTKPAKAALGVLLFACTVEFLQYFRIDRVLGLSRNLLVDLTLGATFDLLDFPWYAAGALAVFALDRWRCGRGKP